MKIRLKKQNRHEPESVNQSQIQAKSLTDIRPMDNALATPQKPQTEAINPQQIQKNQGFNFAEIPITGNTDSAPSRIQPKFNLSLQKKLTVGQAGDKYEQEADSVAEKVVQQINTPTTEKATSSQNVQRQEGEQEEELQAKSDISAIQREGEDEEELQAKSDISAIQREGEQEEELQAKSDISAIQREGEDEEELQAKPDISAIQREGEEEEEIQAKPDISAIQREGEEEEEIQAKPDISAIQREGEQEEELQAKPQNKTMGGGAVSTDIETTIQSAKSGGSSLDAGLQSKMGKAMGADFSGVKVHTDSQADKLNRSLSSRAFATGPNLFFKQGEYNPGSRSGQELIAHELTHVVQQGASKIQSKRESVTHSTGANSVMLQMKPYTVGMNSHSKDATLDKDITNYKTGATVQISDNDKEHKKDRAGNIWWRIQGNPEQYIRYTHLKIYGKNSDQKLEKTDERALRKDNPNLTKHIDELLKKDKRTWREKGKDKKEDLTLVDYIDTTKGFFSEEQVKAIDELSKDPKGKIFLAQNGFMTTEELDVIARDKKTIGDWHRKEKHRGEGLPLATGDKVLSHIHRVQIATRQKELGIADDQYKQTPGYLRYEAQQSKSGDKKEEFKNTIYGKDTDMWEKTLEGKSDNAKPEFQEQAKKYSEQTESAKNILQRIFIILHDGLKYRDDQNKPFEKDWPVQTAVALSHGGRVMVKLPPLANNTQDRNEFINWLLGNDSQEKEKSGSTLKPNKAKKENTEYRKAKVDTRLSSTHDIDIGKDGKFQEIKTSGKQFWGNASVGQSEEHYGMDIPLG
ncbi:MAG TPA: DUF4157 domain-containing protein, partial [Candidatus Obscuribacterales bacterium]